jgi:hypothetical protein
VVLSAHAQNRLNGDGLPYPDAEDRKINVTLPLIKNALGGLPEDVSKSRVFPIQSTLGEPTRWRRMLDEDKVDYTNYQYICANVATAEAALISIDHGRVIQIGLFYPTLTPAKAKSLIAPFGKAGTDAFASDTFFWVTVGTTRIKGALSGTHLYDDGYGVMRPYKCFITIGINPVDWYVLHSKVSDDISKAMLSEHLAKGMTEHQARLTLGEPESVVTDEQNERYLKWKIPYLSAKEGLTMIVIGATFVDGVVDRFTDARPADADK